MLLDGDSLGAHRVLGTGSRDVHKWRRGMGGPGNEECTWWRGRTSNVLNTNEVAGGHLWCVGEGHVGCVNASERGVCGCVRRMGTSGQKLVEAGG